MPRRELPRGLDWTLRAPAEPVQPGLHARSRGAEPRNASAIPLAGSNSREAGARAGLGRRCSCFGAFSKAPAVRRPETRTPASRFAAHRAVRHVCLHFVRPWPHAYSLPGQLRRPITVASERGRISSWHRAVTPVARDQSRCLDASGMLAGPQDGPHARPRPDVPSPPEPTRTRHHAERCREAWFTKASTTPR